MWKKETEQPKDGARERERKAGGMFVRLGARAESGVGLQKGMVPQGDQHGKL